MRCLCIALLLSIVAMSGSACVDEALPNLNMQVGNHSFRILLYDNASARALLGLLPLEMEMQELNGNEKYHYLPDSLPSCDERPGDIHEGDVMLYSSDCLVVFYADFSSSYSYTKLGYVEDPTGLVDALGDGQVAVSLSVYSDAK